MPICPDCFARLDSMHVSGCWNCGAGFRSGGDWKPVPARLAPKNAVISPSTNRLRNLVLFTTPVWGVVLLVLMLAAIEDRGGEVGTLLLFGSALLPFAFLPVLWSSRVLGVAGKFFLSLLYYGMSCVAMLNVGWMAIAYISRSA